MKHSSFKIILIIVDIISICGFILGTIYLGLPLWAILLLFPGLIYTQFYLSQNYSFRNSLQFEQVPEHNDETRLLALKTNQSILTELGFIKFDEFYLRTSQDIIVYAYSHEHLPIIFCDAHFGVFNLFSFTTKFGEEVDLDTSNSTTSHISFRSSKKLHQAFPNSTISELFNRHNQAVGFLEQNGYLPGQIILEKFRYDFLQEFNETGQKIKHPFALIKMLNLQFFGNKAKYTKTIQEQYLAKTLQLP